MARTGIVHGSGHFESGDLTGFGWENDSNEPEVVSSGHPQRIGVYSARFLVDGEASPPASNYRTEIIIQTPDTCEPDAGTTFRYSIDDEYWIGFSVYLHDDWIPQAADGLTDLVLNIEATPDDGEDYRQPVLSIATTTDHWRITSRWDYGAYTAEWDGISYTNVDFNNTVGRWTDFVINVKWSATDDEEGFLKIWIDDELVVNRTGPNCSNDDRGPYHQTGLYAWYMDDEDQQEYINQFIRIYYLDELRIGDDSSSYDDVAPGQLAGIICMIM